MRRLVTSFVKLNFRFIFRVFTIVLLTSTLLISLHLLAQKLPRRSVLFYQSWNSGLCQNPWMNNVTSPTRNILRDETKHHEATRPLHFIDPKLPPSLPPLINLSSKLEVFISQPVINPHPYGYLHNPESICSRRHVDVLFVVPSAPDNVWKRRKVRKSGLGLYSRLRSLKSVGLVFFLGLPKADSKQANITQSIICAEAEFHGDIVQENFTDVYSNIRLKAVSMLRWASTYCSAASYVIRTDDDVIIHTNSIITAVQTVGRNHDNFILGDVKNDYAPNRHNKNKYHVSKEEFANDTYPPFALGGLLGYPMKTVRLLYEASLRVKPLWLDDVYITGICAPEVDAMLLSDKLFKFEHKNLDIGGIF